MLKQIKTFAVGLMILTKYITLVLGYFTLWSAASWWVLNRIYGPSHPGAQYEDFLFSMMVGIPLGILAIFLGKVIYSTGEEYLDGR